MAPLISALRARAQDFDVRICVTSQHRQMLDQALAVFGLKADFDLDLMRENQDLNGLFARTVEAVSGVVNEVRPDWVVVQGDTTTTFAAALCAFHAHVPVAHVEAGLRTGDLDAPFPEELNRRIVDEFARLCRAPTASSAQNLLAEGIPRDRVVVTGNTGLDALRMAIDLPHDSAARILDPLSDRKITLVTVHRRESFGAPLERICDALRTLAHERGQTTTILLPVHPNPQVSELVHSRLGGIDGITLVEPLDYGCFAQVLDRSHMVLTDSGGIQEEAASLGKPALVMRETTERNEGLEGGNAILVGSDPKRIVAEAKHLLDDPDAHAKMAHPSDAYGDGHASERICEALLAAARPA